MTFTNDGTIPHTLTFPAADADTGTIYAGESATLTFTAPTEAGRYEFICTMGGHAEEGMVGALVVE